MASHRTRVERRQLAAGTAGTISTTFCALLKGGVSLQRGLACLQFDTLIDFFHSCVNLVSFFRFELQLFFSLFTDYKERASICEHF